LHFPVARACTLWHHHAARYYPALGERVLRAPVLICCLPSLPPTGVCAMYEQKLKAQNPQHRNITYDISDLFFFIDALGDLSCLGGAPPHH
jgi:hypothetical protein